MPIRWSPPEALSGGLFSSSSDVWAFGVVLWEIFSHGADPYGKLTGLAVAKLVINGKRLSQPKHCNFSVYKIMRSCWQVLPEMRPTFIALNDALKAVRFEVTGDSQADSNVSSIEHKDSSAKSSKADQAVSLSHTPRTDSKSIKSGIPDQVNLYSNGSGDNPSVPSHADLSSPSGVTRCQSSTHRPAVTPVYLRTHHREDQETEV